MYVDKDCCNMDIGAIVRSIFDFLLDNVIMPFTIGVGSSIIATRITVHFVNPEYIIKRKIKKIIKTALRTHKNLKKTIGFDLRILYLSVGENWILYKTQLVELLKKDNINIKIPPEYFMINKRLHEFTEFELEKYTTFYDVFASNFRDEFKMDFMTSEYKSFNQVSSFITKNNDINCSNKKKIDDFEEEKDFEGR